MKIQKSKLRLEHYGFDVINVQEEGKNTVDLRLKYDCIAELKSNSPPDLVILLSGDHGFSNLVDQIKTFGKQIIVIGRKSVTSHKLQRQADEFYYADDLCKRVA